MARRRTEKTSRGGAPSPRRRQSWNWRLVAFLAGVLAVKLTIVTQLQHHPLLQPEGGLDTAAYVRLARQVVSGDLALGPGLYYLSPLYLYFLAGALAIADSLFFVRALQAVLGTAAVGCVFWTARVWYGERAGWIAAALATLTGVFTFYEALILQSSLDPILTAAALLCLSLGLRESFRPKESFRLKAEATVTGAGILFGLQILNRPNVLVAAAGIIVTLLVLGGSRTAPTGAARVRAAALLVAGLAIGLAPVMLRNAIVSRQFALSSSHGGLNFFIGNNAAATGQFNAVPDVRANIEGQAEDTRKVAEKAAGRALTDAQVSAHFTGLAISWIRSDPGAAAKLFVKKLALVFNARHQWLDFSYPYYAYDAGTSLWLLFVGPWLLVPLGLAGLVMGVLRPPSPLRRTARLDRFVEPGGYGGTGEIRDGSYLAWTSFVPLYAMGVAIFFVGERYRLPLFVALCVTAGGALDWMIQAFRQGTPRTSIAAVTVVVLVAAVVTFWPFTLENGRFDERLRLSKVLMNRGDYGLAAMELERAHVLNPSHPIAEFNLGMALVSSGRAAEGIAHVRRAVDAGVAMPGARYALADALMATGDRDGAVVVLRAAAPAPEDTAESCYRVALLALDAGAPDVAERFVRQALTIKPGWIEAEALLAQIRARNR